MAGCAGPVVMTGSPDVFCQGLPLERVGTGAIDAPAAVHRLVLLLDALHSGPWPVMAVVEGTAHGGGVGLAAVADLTIAHPKASFQLPEVLLGLIPAAVLRSVAHRTGWAVARRMALGDPAMNSAEALRTGLVDLVSEDPRREMESRLSRWLRAEPAAMAHVRRLSAQGWPQAEALNAFAGLWAGPAQGRIRRFIAGETPWGEDEL